MVTTASGHRLLPGISSLIGATNELVRACAGNDRPVFVTGELGTEKAFAAKLVHQLSPRAARPMTKINVSWKLPPDLSQYFERCSGGSLIIHLQKEFPIDMQYTLVEMTNHGCFADPMGGEVIEADVRIILITSLEMDDIVERTPLLPELKDLLAAQHIEVPPLRSRPEDIPALVRYAIKRALDTGRSRATAVAPSVLSLFRQWHWPGNAEDLLLVTAQAAIGARGDLVTLEDLPETFIRQLPDEAINLAKTIRQSSDRVLRPASSFFDPTPEPVNSRTGRALSNEPVQLVSAAEPPPATQEAPAAAPGETDANGAPKGDEKDRVISPRVLTLARRLNAQASLLSKQFTGPLDGPTTRLMVERLMHEASDEEALAALESELDHGLDLVLALRRQMAVLNLRQQQNAETVRDLIQRLSFAADSGQPLPMDRPDIAAETKELAESLNAIDKIIQRVSDELPHVGQHIEATLLGNPSERRHTTSGLFPKLEIGDQQQPQAPIA